MSDNEFSFLEDRKYLDLIKKKIGNKVNKLNITNKENIIINTWEDLKSAGRLPFTLAVKIILNKKEYYIIIYIAFSNSNYIIRDLGIPAVVYTNNSLGNLDENDYNELKNYFTLKFNILELKSNKEHTIMLGKNRGSDQVPFTKELELDCFPSYVKEKYRENWESVIKNQIVITNKDDIWGPKTDLIISFNKISEAIASAGRTQAMSKFQPALQTVKDEINKEDILTQKIVEKKVDGLKKIIEESTLNKDHIIFLGSLIEIIKKNIKKDKLNELIKILYEKIQMLFILTDFKEINKISKKEFSEFCELIKFYENFKETMEKEGIELPDDKMVFHDKIFNNLYWAMQYLVNNFNKLFNQLNFTNFFDVLEFYINPLISVLYTQDNFKIHTEFSKLEHANFGNNNYGIKAINQKIDNFLSSSELFLLFLKLMNKNEIISHYTKWVEIIQTRLKFLKVNETLGAEYTILDAFLKKMKNKDINMKDLDISKIFSSDQFVPKIEKTHISLSEKNIVSQNAFYVSFVDLKKYKKYLSLIFEILEKNKYFPKTEINSLKNTPSSLTYTSMLNFLKKIDNNDLFLNPFFEEIFKLSKAILEKIINEKIENVYYKKVNINGPRNSKYSILTGKAHDTNVTLIDLDKLTYLQGIITLTNNNVEKWKKIYESTFNAQEVDNFLRLMIYYLYHILNNNSNTIVLIKSKDKPMDKEPLEKAVKDLNK